jgi:hypothetical protein
MSLLTVAFTVLGSAGNLAGNDRSQDHGLAHAAPAAAVAREYMSGLQPNRDAGSRAFVAAGGTTGTTPKLIARSVRAPADYRDSARERRMVLALFAPHPYHGVARLQVAERWPRSGLLPLGSQPAAPRQPPRHSPSIEIGRLAAHSRDVQPVHSRLAQLLRQLLPNEIASDKEDRSLCHPLGAGTGGVQVTASILGPNDVLKVIDQGADDTTNAVSIRSFFKKTAGLRTTTSTLEATVIETRHRIPD